MFSFISIWISDSGFLLSRLAARSWLQEIWLSWKSYHWSCYRNSCMRGDELLNSCWKIETNCLWLLSIRKRAPYKYYWTLSSEKRIGNVSFSIWLKFCSSAINDLEENIMRYQTVSCNYSSIATCPELDTLHIILVCKFLSMNLMVGVPDASCFDFLKSLTWGPWNQKSVLSKKAFSFRCLLRKFWKKFSKITDHP